MPYQISWQSSYAYFQYSGVVSSEDIIESNKAIYGDPRFDSLRWQLVDFDKAESIDFKPSDIRLIAYMDRAAASSNPKVTIAFLGSSQILEEVATAYDTVDGDSPWPLLHFDSFEEATAYIEQSEK